MYADAPGARAAASAISETPGIGAIQIVASQAIVDRMAEQPEQAEGMPSVGREDQFMRRFVELARQGMTGLLVEVDEADTHAITQALLSPRPELAYHYRLLVIEELVDTSARAEAAAAGKL